MAEKKMRDRMMRKVKVPYVSKAVSPNPALIGNTVANITMNPHVHPIF